MWNPNRRFKHLCLFFAGCFLGWFSASIITDFSNLANGGTHTTSNIFHIMRVSDEIASPLILPTGERWSCPKANASSQFTNTAFYRESLRRRSIKTLRHMWSVIHINLSGLRATTGGIGNQSSVQLQSSKDSLEKFLKDATLYVLANLHKTEKLDDAKLCRRESLNQLSKLVQARIKSLQNPSDCTRAKFLLADVSWPCGYGCHVHYFMFCFNMAYATGRTFISESQKTYCGKWWAESYMPFSDKCSMNDIGKDEVVVGMDSSSFNSSARVMRCTFKFFFQAQNVSVAPPVVPKDLAPLLLTLHGQPAIWFLGQLVQYLMRPLPKFKSQLNELALSSNLPGNPDSPIVGVHVRRTDKIHYHEAEFHNLSEYMIHVERYFDLIDRVRLLETEKTGLRRPKVQRQIYLASDDPSVFEDMKVQYPHYIVHNTTSKKFTEAAGGRYPTDSRTHIAMEIFLLSLTDYIVCTLSSNVCRVAYELMQARQKEIGDAGDLVHTLDTSYFWDFGQTMKCEMVQDDEAMNLHRGDVVDIWSGNLNSRFEHERLTNKTYFLDPPYNCVYRVVISEMKGPSVQ